jgi:hypothetical protein
VNHDKAKAREFFLLLTSSYTHSLNLVLGNDEIESQLKRDRMMAKNEIKMLLLGAGESGKVSHYLSDISLIAYIHHI